MELLSTISLDFCVAIALAACGDHVALHQADIDALESHDAHVSITDLEPSPFEEQKFPERRISYIYIPETWRGGDDGLTHVDRIFADAPDPQPVVIIVGTPEISAERLKKLKETLPDGSVARRSSVSLGVSSSAGLADNGVLVNGVVPDSSAARAGILAGDVIIRMDNTDIADFDSLVESLSKRKPGQTVVVRVLRDGEQRKMAVKLQGWQSDRRANRRTKR